MKLRTTALAALVTVLALAACAQSGGTDASDGTGAQRPTPRAAPTASVPAHGGDGIAGHAPEELVSQVLADAAERTSIAEDEIEVVTARGMSWNDGSLGCPEPGQMYTQALVEGYQVIVEAGDERLDYRADHNARFRLCENPTTDGGGPADQ